MVKGPHHIKISTTEQEVVHPKWEEPVTRPSLRCSTKDFYLYTLCAVETTDPVTLNSELMRTGA